MEEFNNKNHPTHYKGDWAEAAVVYHLTILGYVVFKCQSQNFFADLAVFKDNRLQTIQVKYVTPKDGKIIVPLKRKCCTMAGVATTYLYKDTPLEWIAVFNPETQLICYLPRKIWENNKDSLIIHVDDPIYNLNCYMFHDFQQI